MRALYVYYLRSRAVQTAIEKHHVTHAEVAAALKISRSYWSQLCNRHRPLTAHVRQKLLKAHYFKGLTESALWDVIETGGGES